MTKSESELTWKDLEIGFIVTEPGNASQYKTGDWRSQRPIFDRDKCNKNASSAISSVLRGALNEMLRAILKPTYFIARGVASVLKSAGEKQ